MASAVLPLLDGVFSDWRLAPLLFGIIAVVFLLSSVRRKLRIHQAEDEDRESPQREPPAVNRQDIRRDLESLLVELQELSRRISAEIDTRFVKLESAIRDADRRIAVMNRLIRQMRSTAPDNAVVSEGDETDVRYGIVYELADAGFSALEIARDLGKTPGEVELILNLRKSAGSGGSGKSGSSAAAPRKPEIHPSGSKPASAKRAQKDA